jgi:hypothetical protein
MVFYFEFRQQLPRWRLMLDVVLVQVVVFSYAFSFFAGWETKQAFQKLCIMGVFYALLKIVSASEQGFRPREFFMDFLHFQH